MGPIRRLIQQQLLQSMHLLSCWDHQPEKKRWFLLAPVQFVLDAASFAALWQKRPRGREIAPHLSFLLLWLHLFVRLRLSSVRDDPIVTCDTVEGVD